MEELSTDPVTSAAPPGAHARSWTSSECPRRVFAVFHDVRSPWRFLVPSGARLQRRTSPVSPPDARMSPPGENRTTLTALVCAVRVSRCVTSAFPSASSPRDQSFTSLSAPPVTRRPVAGSKSTENTGAGLGAPAVLSAFACHSTWMVLTFIVVPGRARSVMGGAGNAPHFFKFFWPIPDCQTKKVACHCRSPSRPHSSPRVPTLSKCCARRCEPLGRRCGGSFPCDSRTRAVRRSHHSLGTTLGSRFLPHLGRKLQICVASGIHPNAAEIRCTADGFAT